jgi:hypothetical protein
MAGLEKIPHLGCAVSAVGGVASEIFLGVALFTGGVGLAVIGLGLSIAGVLTSCGPNDYY